MHKFMGREIIQNIIPNSSKSLATIELQGNNSAKRKTVLA